MIIMSLLVALIYLAFISLGLPDSLLGSGWPVMRVDLQAPLSAAAIITSIIFLATIISALMSDSLIRKLGTGRVTAFSVLLTAVSMLGFSFAGRFWMLCAIAVPYGFGAGAIDACLNNYVALHLSSRHMSWLHFSWGLGAVISPYIMGASIASQWGWRGGYRSVSLIQFVLAAILIASIPLWKKHESRADTGSAEKKKLTFVQVIRLPGALLLFSAFALYCAVEQFPIVWASSYFSEVYRLEPRTAAFFGSLFYIGMMAGRAVCGIIADRFTDKLLIRYGMITAFASSLLIIIPSRSYIPALVGFVALGLGCAPVYPSLVHATPDNFGRENSQSVIGVQMASAYLGMFISPPVFGKLAERLSIAYLPYLSLAFTVVIIILTELMNRKVQAGADRARN
jgi:MFS family permease